MSLRLSDFPLEFQRLSDMLDESLGEITPEIEALLDTLPGDLNAKVNRIGYIVTSRYAEAKARREFVQTQNGIANAAENSGLRLCQYTGNILQSLGHPMMETESWNVSVYSENGPDCALFTPRQAQTAPTVDLLSEQDELIAAAVVIRENGVLLAAYEKMIADLKAVRDELEAKIKEQKDHLCETMVALDIPRIDTPTCKLRTQINSAGSMLVDGFDGYEDSIPSEFKIQPPAPPAKVSYDAVKQLWSEAGKPDEWVAFEMPADEENGIPVRRIAIKRGKHIRIS